MKRDLNNTLQAWAQGKFRTPLILKGARQVGKSWLIDHFAENHFEHYLKINFEKQAQFKVAFENEIDIPQLLEKLTLYTGTPIIPGKTLLFLDEIQECPNAILYLRYFKEEYPDLHVIAAGSLLEFILENIGMPVGRVDYLFLTPLSFGEFLTANGRDDLRALNLESSNDPMLDKILKDYLRSYMWLGGMPEVVQAWIEHKDPHLCQSIQNRLINAYRDDFLKYAKKRQVEHVAKVFESVPLQLGNKFVYTKVDAELRAMTLNKALELLEKANIIHQCFFTSGQKPPLHASINEKFFKTFFLDIGIAQRLLGLEYKDWILNPISIDNIGNMTEQFVAQELIASLSKNRRAEVFYWQREVRGSSAEIDLLISVDSKIFPIEVKSGKTGRLKSLRIYMETHPHIQYGIVISEKPYAKENGILQIPLYMIEQWLRQEE